MAPAALRRARVRSIQAVPSEEVGAQATGERRWPGGHPQRHRRSLRCNSECPAKRAVARSLRGGR
eukprot:10499252-Lingulodinium_polyedra.AAC.1